MDWQERTELLLGVENIKILQSSHVLVVGLGGVGAYAAEMLCRAGVGKLTLVDSDEIHPSNINRQLIALTSTIGQKKTNLLDQRLKQINPKIETRVFDSYMNEENMPMIFDVNYHYIIDAIDTLSPKIALIQQGLKLGIPLVSSMGAGAKLDPSKIQIADISKSNYCPLAHQLRKRLSRLGIKKGFKVVFSSESPLLHAMQPCDERNKKTMVGTISYLPAIFGCMCASEVIRTLIHPVSL